MSSKLIERSIEDICDYIAECKPKGFSGTQVIVDKEKLIDMLDELKRKLPDEVERSSRVIDKRDQIIKEAELRAKALIEDAERKAASMVRESEISRQAYLQANEYLSMADAQANEMMANVNRQAEEIRSGALEYTKDMLLQIETVMQTTFDNTKQKSEEYLETLRRNLDIVIANRKELCEEVAPDESEIEEITGGDYDGSQFDGQYDNTDYRDTDSSFFGEEENNDENEEF